MKTILSLLFVILALSSCHRTGNGREVASIQLIDRHGFSESISTPERLDSYKNMDFSSPQPYHKITRFFKRNQEGKVCSIITSYHENGSLWQELEVMNGRANGKYQEWHPNGQQKLDATVLEGLGDLSQTCINSWVFHGKSQAWNEKGTLVAEIFYHRGELDGVARYFHQNGKIKEKVPYVRGKIHGNLLQYDDKESLIGNSRYREGAREGLTVFKGNKGCPRFTEEYHSGKLARATYYDFNDAVFAEINGGEGVQAVFQEGKLKELHTIKGGVIDGEVKIFDDAGHISNQFLIKDGQKHGEEIIYHENSDRPKLSLEWYEDELQGKIRTYYSNGALESEKQIHQNKRHGPSLAWYKEGSLMLMEDYEHDILVKGEYFARGSNESVSSIDGGDGVATLHDADGYFLRRISYLKGIPFDE